MFGCFQTTCLRFFFVLECPACSVHSPSTSWASLCATCWGDSRETDRHNPCPHQGLRAWLERHTWNENYTNKDSHSTKSPHVSTVSSTELGTWWVLFHEYVTWIFVECAEGPTSWVHLSTGSSKLWLLEWGENMTVNQWDLGSGFCFSTHC